MKTIYSKDNCVEINTEFDKQSGCTFIIAIETCYGKKGNGGTRMLDYKTIDDGIKDAISLSLAMTKKCIVIGKEYNAGYSGAKGVIVGNPETQKTPDMLRRYGKFVQSLNGRFQTGSDVNINLKDIEYMAETSDYVDGLASGLGDTAIPTAYGIFLAMKKIVKWKYGSESLKDKIIAVQGVGSVGSNLIKRLVEENAIVIATDIDTKKLKKVAQEFKIKTVEPDEIYKVKCDIFSPNAVGGILNDRTIPKLNCNLIIGGANNQLQDNLKSAIKIRDKNIVYVPDYLINFGGVFLSICETQGKTIDYVNKKLNKLVYLRLEQVISLSLSSNRTLYEAAEIFIKNNKYEL